VIVSQDVQKGKRGFLPAAGRAWSRPDGRGGMAASDGWFIARSKREKEVFGTSIGRAPCRGRRLRRPAPPKICGPRGAQVVLTVDTNVFGPRRGAGGGLDIAESTFFSFRCRSPGGCGEKTSLWGRQPSAGHFSRACLSIGRLPCGGRLLNTLSIIRYPLPTANHPPSMNRPITPAFSPAASCIALWKVLK